MKTGILHVLGLGNMNNRQILNYLREGRYILHSVKQETILTQHGIEDLTKMIKLNSLNLTNVTLL